MVAAAVIADGVIGDGDSDVDFCGFACKCSSYGSSQRSHGWSVPRSLRYTFHCASLYSSRITRTHGRCSTHATTHTSQAWAALPTGTLQPPLLHPHPCNFSPPPLFMPLPFTAWGQQGYPVSKLLACSPLISPCLPPTLRPLPMVLLQPEHLCHPSGFPVLLRLRFETLMRQPLSLITKQPPLTPPAGLQHRVRTHLPPFPSPPSRPQRHPLSSTPITLSNTCLSYVYNLPLDWTDEQVSRVDLPAQRCRSTAAVSLLTQAQLKTLGLSIGAILRATVCVNRATGASKGANDWISYFTRHTSPSTTILYISPS